MHHDNLPLRADTKCAAPSTLRYGAAVAVLLCLAGAGSAQGGAWTQNDGSYLIGLSFSRTETRQAFDNHGKRSFLYAEFPLIRERAYSSTDINLTVEYGVSSEFTLLGKTRLRQATASYVDTMFVQKPNSGLGDIAVAGRYALLKDPLMLSLQVGIKIPAADTGSWSAVALGNGTMDFDATVAAGYAVATSSLGGHAQSYFGWRFRGGGFGDEITYGGEVGGAALGGRLGVVLALDASITQGKIAAPTGDVPAAGYAITYSQSIVRLAAGARYRATPKLQFQFEWSTAMAGRGALAGNVISFGVAFTPAAVETFPRIP